MLLAAAYAAAGDIFAAADNYDLHVHNWQSSLVSVDWAGIGWGHGWYSLTGQVLGGQRVLHGLALLISYLL